MEVAGRAKLYVLQIIVRVDTMAIAKTGGKPTSEAAPKVNNNIVDNDDIPVPTYFAYWSRFPTQLPVFSHSFMCAVVLVLCATNSLPLLQSTIQYYLSVLSLLLLRLVFLSTAILSLLHQSGALRRYAIKFAEAEYSKLMNGAMVTVSDAHVDIFRGKVVVHDFIIHNKDRDVWEWDSPCLVRVGRIEASLNFASVIQLPGVGRILNHSFFDIYTMLVEDVQVFVEKRRNVFNFHLMDPSLDIPDHDPIMKEYNNRKERALSESEKNDKRVDATKSHGLDAEEQRGDAASGRDVASPLRDKEDEANKIIEKLVGTVSNLGKAAGEGGSHGLKLALISQKDSLVKNLKELHSKTPASPFVKEGKDHEEDWSRRKNKVKSLGNALGKVVEQNVSDIKHQMGFLQQPPPKKEGWVSSNPDHIRVGSLMLRESRIFTKDVLVGKGEEALTEAEKGSMDRHFSGWSRPIVVYELALTGAEMSPSMSARDPRTGMPVVGIPIDQFLDILNKKLMAEVAKYNTGRLFQQAFGDVFSFVDANNSSRNREAADDVADS